MPARLVGELIIAGNEKRWIGIFFSRFSKRHPARDFARVCGSSSVHFVRFGGGSFSRGRKRASPEVNSDVVGRARKRTTSIFSSLTTKEHVLRRRSPRTRHALRSCERDRVGDFSIKQLFRASSLLAALDTRQGSRSMNPEKLKKLQAQVRIGGKGTPRRKKKVSASILSRLCEKPSFIVAISSFRRDVSLALSLIRWFYSGAIVVDAWQREILF